MASTQRQHLKQIMRKILMKKIFKKNLIKVEKSIALFTKTCAFCCKT